MNKIYFLAFSGLMMILAGLILLFFEKLGVQISKILMPLCMVVAGISIFLFSKYRELPRIATQYHMAQGLGLVVYGILVLSSANSIDNFLLITTYFIIAYGLFELVFAFGVLGSDHTIKKDILMSRLLAGGLNLIGGFVLLMATLNSVSNGLMIASILIVIGGISLIIFSRKI